MTAVSPELPLWDTPVTHRFGVAMSLHDPSNPHVTRVVHAIEDAAADAGCAITLADTGDSVATEAEVVRSLREQNVDGVLLSPAAGDDSVVTGLVRLGIPTVLVDHVANRNDVDRAGAENIQAVSALVRHLATRGHRRIGFVADLPGRVAGDERALGYRLGLGRAGLRWNPDLVANGRGDAGGGAAATGKLLDDAPAPSALVVANEAMLVGVHYELHRRGLRIGDDVALVAYGDPAWARTVDPALTVMAPPVAEIGRAAVHLLLRKLTDPERSPEAVRLAPEFRHRTSCGC